MLKKHAIELLGGTITQVAKAIGISYQAIDKWPDELPPRIADRVYAVWGRENMPDKAQAAAAIAQAATETVAICSPEPLNIESSAQERRALDSRRAGIRRQGG